MASGFPKAFSTVVIAMGFVGTGLFGQMTSSRAATVEPVRLAWARGQGADFCASPAEIEDLVAKRLSTAPFSNLARRSIEAIVEHTEHGWRVRIQVREGSNLVGTRELTSDTPDCEAVQSAAVLAIALVIDPNAKLSADPVQPPIVVSSEAPPPAPPPPPPPTTVTSAVPAQPITPKPPPPSQPCEVVPQGQASLSMRGAVAAGLVPDASPAVELVGKMPLGSSWSWLAQSLVVAESQPDDERFSFGLAAFGLGACYHEGESITVGVCASGWLGSTWAVVHALTPTHPGGRAYMAISVGPMLRMNLAGPVDVELGADLFVPLKRRAFTVTGWDEPVWRQPTVGGWGWGGLGLHF